MKDRVFEGSSVAAALELAASTTGLAATQLRHVVLDPGQPGGPGQPGRPARVAVLLGAVASVPAQAPAPSAAVGSGAALASCEALVELLGRAAGLPLQARVESGPETSVVVVEGGDEFLLQDDAAVLRALEHVLQRSVGEQYPGRLALDVPGYRQAREAQLQAQARAWAERVRTSGQPTETPPMNAYDRRLVHIALAQEPGVRTFSVGEGSRRRVTIAPSPPLVP